MITGIAKEHDEWGTHLTLSTDTHRKEYLITILNDGSLQFESSLYHRFKDFKEFIDKLYGKTDCLQFVTKQLIKKHRNVEK